MHKFRRLRHGWTFPLVFAGGLASGCGSNVGQVLTRTPEAGAEASDEGVARRFLEPRNVREGAVYYIGHSLLEDPLPGLVNMMAVAGGAIAQDANEYAAQIGGGFPLFMHWSHRQDEGALKPSINDMTSSGTVARLGQAERLARLQGGLYGAVIVTEEYGYAESEDDLSRAASHFFARWWHDLAARANPETQFFVYENWNEGHWFPGTRIDEEGRPVDYFDPPPLEAFVDGVATSTNYRFEMRVDANGPQWREFVQAIRGGPLEFENPGWIDYDGPTPLDLPPAPQVAFIPAGTGLAELARRIRSGEVPDMTLFGEVSSQEDCYAFNEEELLTPIEARTYRFIFDPCYAGGPPDYAHVTPLGMYLPALITAAVVFHVDPRGLTDRIRSLYDLSSLQYDQRAAGEFPRGEAIPMLFPEGSLMHTMEQIAWEVVTREPLTGFPVQE